MLESALAGDRRALRRLIERLTPVIHSRVGRCFLRWRQHHSGKVREEVEDLVQEVFVSLFDQKAKALRDWEPERGLSLENFVGLVAERRTISVLRSNKRNPGTEYPFPHQEFDFPAAEVSPDLAIASRDQLSRLLARLRRELSPEGWQLFDLLYIQDKSVAEVGRALALSSAAIYSWRQRLRQRIARLSTESILRQETSKSNSSQEVAL